MDNKCKFHLDKSTYYYNFQIKASKIDDEPWHDALPLMVPSCPFHESYLIFPLQLIYYSHYGRLIFNGTMNKIAV